MRALYTRWDGTARTRLDPDKIFEALAEYMSANGDLEGALDMLLARGMSTEEFEVVGVDALMERIREAIEDLFGKYNLDHCLDRKQQALRELVEAEEAALDALAWRQRRPQAQELLRNLPVAIDFALDRLHDYEFVDAGAAADRDNLEVDGDDIRRVARFVRRHAADFVGPESVDFEGALALLERLRALRELERQLARADFNAIDGETARELLGNETAEAIERLREMMAALEDSGYLIPKGGRFALSPKGARKVGQLALKEIFSDLNFDSAGRHGIDKRGVAEVELAASKPYAFGDPLTVDLAATLRNALRRDARLPLDLEPGDFEVFDSRRSTKTATVMLLDMSWSMSWEGRFAAAKKVALAMDCLMRRRYPSDYFSVVGFYTRAVEVKLRDLPEVTWNMGDPFTNLQDGLRLGAKLLDEHHGANKQMIVITDGQPTAYFSQGRLFCEWPMSVGGLSTRATVETLKEVGRVTRKGVVINTFMLDDSPPLRAFVDKMTAVNKGRAFYTTPSALGHFLLVDYIGHRRKVL